MNENTKNTITIAVRLFALANALAFAFLLPVAVIAGVLATAGVPTQMALIFASVAVGAFHLRRLR